MIEAGPSILCASIVTIIVLLCLTDRQPRKWTVPLAWFVPTVGWTLSFVGYWLADYRARPLLDATIGILITLTGPAILLIGIAVATDHLPRRTVIFAYLPAVLVLGAAAACDSLKVTCPIFAVWQFPYLLVMDSACITLLSRAALCDSRRDIRRFASYLAPLLAAGCAIGAISFYLSFFHFGDPRIHAWFGDLAITGSIVATYAIWKRFYFPGNPKWRRVFVVYGRDKSAYHELCTTLNSLGLEPIELGIASGACKNDASLGEIVRFGMREAQAIVILFTPDEFAALRGELRTPDDTSNDRVRWQARPNVIFEAGLAFGIDAQRTILVTVGSDVTLFSDVAGVHFARLGSSAEQLALLRNKLIAAGCSLEPCGNASPARASACTHDSPSGYIQRRPVDPFLRDAERCEELTQVENNT